MRRLLATGLLLWIAAVIGCSVAAPTPDIDAETVRQQKEAREKTRAEESKKR